MTTSRCSSATAPGTINPYLALESLRPARALGQPAALGRRAHGGDEVHQGRSRRAAQGDVQDGHLDDPVYCGAQMFEAIGLGPRGDRALLHRHRVADQGRLEGSPTRCSSAIADRVSAVRTAADDLSIRRRVPLAPGRRNHTGEPARSSKLQQATRSGQDAYGESRVSSTTTRSALRGLLTFKPTDAGRFCSRRWSRPSES